MAGRLVVSTLNNDTGVLNVQNGMTGIAKAWVNFTGGGNGTSSGAIRGSFNVSSITVNATGDYTANFTTSMPNATYAYTGTVNEGYAGGPSAVQGVSKATATVSGVRFYTITPAGSIVNCDTASVVVFSS